MQHPNAVTSQFLTAVMKRILLSLRFRIRRYNQFLRLPTFRTNHSLKHVPTFVINLRRDQAKKRWMTRQLNKLSVASYTFIDAYDAQATNFPDLKKQFQYNEELCKQFENKPLSDSIIALAATHFEIYDRILSQNIPFGLILEDDAIFVNKALQHFTLDSLPPTWDVVLLEAWLKKKPPLGHIAGNYFDLTSYKGGSAAYLINREGAKKLLNLRHPLVHPPDGLFKWHNIHANEKRLSYSAKPNQSLTCIVHYPCPVINGSLAGFWPSSCDGLIVSY
jgi:glycosyl transferase family 25